MENGNMLKENFTNGISRRFFLGMAGLAAVDAAAATQAKVVSQQGAPLKVCVFSDLHYYPGVWTNDTTEFLEKIMTRAAEANCDMMVHLGDFVHNVDRPDVKSLVRMYNEFRVPGYHVLGNHDQDGTDWRKTVEVFGMPGAYYSFDKGGFRFVVTDPNYFCNEPGKFIHHSCGNYFRRVKGSTINWIPPEQLEWLRSTILESPYPCVVLSHQSFERPATSAGVVNQNEVRAVFNEANRRRPGSVRLVMNGHMHMDNFRIMDDILYWDVNSANYYYIGKPHKMFPAEYVAKHRNSPWNIGWKDPLSAILTLWPDGRIRIEGSQSDYLFGVSPDKAGVRGYDGCGRYIKPVIGSMDIAFKY